MGRKFGRTQAGRGAVGRKPSPQAGVSLRLRIFLWLFLPIGLLLGGLGWFAFEKVGTVFEARMQEEVELIARSLAGPLSYSMQRDRRGSVADALETAFVFDRVYGAFLYDLEGNLLAGAGEGDTKARHGDRFAERAERGQTGGEYNVSRGQSVFSFFVPIQNEAGERTGILQVTRNSSEMRATLAALQDRFLLGYFVVMLLLLGVLAVGYRISIDRPLAALHQTMRRIELGRRHERAPTNGPRELSDLGGALNRMLGAIEKQQAEISQKEVREAKLRRRLKGSERLAVLGEMAASIGHEIGTPLATVDGIAQRGLRKTEDPASRKILEEIRGGVGRIDAFLRQLLSFGDRSNTESVPLDLAAVLDQAITSTTGKDGAERELCELRNEAPEGAAVVCGEALRLHIALKNLVKNAVQSKPGGRVLCSVSRERNEVVCRIEDEGPGIPPEDRERLFEPFVSERREGGGTGLGLALAERAVAEHGGRIEIGDSPMGGARFTIRLPAHEKEVDFQ